MTAVARSISEILSLYERWGSDHYDEDLCQLAHALQTVALAERAGSAEELIVASLLHDVGHLLELEAAGSAAAGARVEPTADLGHEAVGAKYLSALFAPAVTAPIALHVRAKRYRCAVDATYHAGLSDGSKRSLELQGGAMNPTETAAFELNPGFKAAVALRGWDDGGKVDGLEVPTLDRYVDMITRVANAKSPRP